LRQPFLRRVREAPAERPKSAIRHNQTPSGVIRRHQASSDAIRRHQASSGALTCREPKAGRHERSGAPGIPDEEGN
jgi:hypothetical protein